MSSDSILSGISQWSAEIAKIPEELSRHIARFYRPHEAQRAR